MSQIKREKMVMARNIGFAAVLASMVFVSGIGLTSNIKQRDVQESSDAAEVYAGVNTSFVVDKDDRVWAKGLNSAGQLGIGSTDPVDQWTEVLLGDERIKKMSVGKAHNTALTQNNEILSWGDNRTGTNGNGNTNISAQPVKVTASYTFSKLTAGENFVLAVDTNGTLYAWGENKYGQLGTGDKDERLIPTAISFPGGPIKDMKAGKNFVIVLTEDGNIWSWGDNTHGQLGSGDKNERLKPEFHGVNRISSVNTNLTSETVTAITDEGILLSWGSNSHGQLGNGEDWRQQQVDENERVKREIAAVKAADVQRKADLIQACVKPKEDKWKEEEKKRQEAEAKKKAEEDKKKAEEEAKKEKEEAENEENGEEKPKPTPTPTPTPEPEKPAPVMPDYAPECTKEVEKDFKETDTSDMKPRTIPEPALKEDAVSPVALREDIRFIYSSAGSQNGAAIDVLNRLYTWGSDASGQNGNNIVDEKTHTQVPLIIDNSKSYSKVEMSDRWSVAIDDVQGLFVWGKNQNGVLVSGGKTEKTPRKVSEGFVDISVSANNGYATKANQDNYAWGSNENGTLGADVKEKFSSSFVQVGAQLVKVAPTGSSVVALGGNNLLYAWGADDKGTFGEGAASDEVTVIARRIQEVKKFTDIATGDRFSLALDEKGRVWMWGANSGGVNGKGKSDNILYPVPVPLDKPVSKIAATLNGGYALSDDTLIRWGDNAPIVEFEAPKNVTNLEGGAHHASLLTKDGEIWVTSTSASAIQPNPDEPLESETLTAAPGKGYTSISSGLTDTIVAAKKDSMFIWGDKAYNPEFGDNLEDYNIHEFLSEAGPPATASLSPTHALMLDKNGIIWGWGEEPAGTFGKKVKVSQPEPVSFNKKTLGKEGADE